MRLDLATVLNSASPVEATRFSPDAKFSYDAKSMALSPTSLHIIAKTARQDFGFSKFVKNKIYNTQ